MAEIKDVKAYWEKNTPQYWYTEKAAGTPEYYEDIIKYRYTVAYPFLPQVSEFKDHKGEKVLEIGCGQGTDSTSYAFGGADITGVDLTEGGIAKTQKMFDALGLKGAFHVANAENLALFEDNSFDLVYSFGVLHHTPNTQKTFNEVHRILKPGGRAIIMLYSKGSSYLLRILRHLITFKFLFQSLQTTINKTTEYKGNSPLTKMYSAADLRPMFSAFDIETIEKHHWYVMRYMAPKMPGFFVTLLKPFEKLLGDFILTKAVKKQTT